LVLILIGMMGAGKTTVGRELARRHDMTFIDCDHEIEARCGVSIPTIFEIEGEDGFRRRETQTLDELTREDNNIVLATGGGAVLVSRNRKMMRTRGTAVYLDVRPGVLWERTRQERTRPLLKVPNPRARLFELHKLRQPLYRETAHLIVEGGRGNPLVMVRAIEDALAAHGKPLPRYGQDDLEEGGSPPLCQDRNPLNPK
jgi:shikimate kinase